MSEIPVLLPWEGKQKQENPIHTLRPARLEAMPQQKQESVPCRVEGENRLPNTVLSLPSVHRGSHGHTNNTQNLQFTIRKTNGLEDMEGGGCTHCGREGKPVQPLRKQARRLLEKTKDRPYDPDTASLAIYPKAFKSTITEMPAQHLLQHYAQQLT